MRMSLGLVALLLAVAAQAEPTSSSSEEGVDGWLERLGTALNTTSYRGVFVYSRGDQVSSMRIVHRYRDSQVQERLVIQDGGQGEIIRHGGRVFCVLPSHGRIQLDAVLPSGPFSEAFTPRFAPFRRWYAAKMLKDDRVAGHEAVVIVLNPKDVHRYQYRLWLEKTSGLLVKSQVLTNDEEVLERFQFTMLELTDEIPDSEFIIPESGKTREITLEKPNKPRPEVHSQVGWTLGWHPEGFQATPSSPKDTRRQAVSFSDGLASFSVFVSPVGEMDMPTGVSRIGATTIFLRKLTVEDQRHLVTVVGEIPPQTAMKVAESVEVESLAGDESGGAM